MLLGSVLILILENVFPIHLSVDLCSTLIVSSLSLFSLAGSEVGIGEHALLPGLWFYDSYLKYLVSFLSVLF